MNLKQIGIKHQIDSLMKDSFFDIMKFDAAAKVLGVSIDPEDRELLRSVHCFKWDENKEAGNVIRQRVIELLGTGAD